CSRREGTACRWGERVVRVVVVVRRVARMVMTNVSFEERGSVGSAECVSVLARPGGGGVRIRSPAERVKPSTRGGSVVQQAGFAQRHIRQHMTTRRGIIAPVTPFASRADRSSVSSVMGAIVAAHLVTCQRMTVF